MVKFGNYLTNTDPAHYTGNRLAAQNHTLILAFHVPESQEILFFVIVENACHDLSLMSVNYVQIFISYKYSIKSVRDKERSS